MYVYMHIFLEHCDCRMYNLYEPENESYAVVENLDFEQLAHWHSRDG